MSDDEIIYRVQVHDGQRWNWPIELGDSERDSIFRSWSEAEDARARLVEEYDYPSRRVRVQECVTDDEGGGLLPIRRPDLSGPSHTEAQKRERFDAIKLRLPLGYKSRLQALAADAGYTASERVAKWIEGEAQREKPARPSRA